MPSFNPRSPDLKKNLRLKCEGEGALINKSFRFSQRKTRMHSKRGPQALEAGEKTFGGPAQNENTHDRTATTPQAMPVS